MEFQGNLLASQAAFGSPGSAALTYTDTGNPGLQQRHFTRKGHGQLTKCRFQFNTEELPFLYLTRSSGLQSSGGCQQS